MSKRIERTGQRFGRLLVLEVAHRNKHGDAMWLCLCDCGNQPIVGSWELSSGNTQSCGCLGRELRASGALRLRHGEAKKNKQSVEHMIWSGMKARCFNPNNKEFANYGGRGITVCERWRDSFEAFVEDVGRRPSPEHTLDRIENTGPYDISNVRWATRVEQSRNKRTTHYLELDGQRKCIRDWSLETGINELTLHWRIKSGWSVERALTEPVRRPT